MSAKKITVLCVDDHVLLREGIAAVLAEEDDIEMIGEACNGEQAIHSFRLHRPDVTLMDLQMPAMNGIDTIIAIRKEFPDARIVVLTTYEGDVQARRALKAGAVGYLLKSMLRKDLPKTIRIVHSGKRHIPPEVAASLAEHAVDDPLTNRELDVLRTIAAGNSNKATAEKLQISEPTVKAHVQNILLKLGANDRTHAVVIALKRGFLDG